MEEPNNNAGCLIVIVILLAVFAYGIYYNVNNPPPVRTHLVGFVFVTDREGIPTYYNCGNNEVCYRSSPYTQMTCYRIDGWNTAISGSYNTMCNPIVKE